MIQAIISPDNKQIKFAAALRLKKYRDETGMFLLEGIHLLEAALAALWHIEHVFVCDGQAELTQVAKLVETVTAKGIPIYKISPALFKKIAETDAPQGIAAVCRQQRRELSEMNRDLFIKHNLPWVVLDAVQDPGNVGTIVRNADAAGVAGLILTPGCADLYAGKTVRATMGSLFHIPTYCATVRQCLDFFSLLGTPVYIADAVSAENYLKIDWTKACAVVFGNEGAGVSESFRIAHTRAIAIPMVGKAESLNVASATAVILFEAARQRGLSLS